MRRSLTVMALSLALVTLSWLPASGTTAPLLGSTAFAAPHGAGWGHPHPRRIDNGGDPAGIVIGIQWRHWGHARAIGVGRTYLSKPGGGYYAHTGAILLRASRLADCGDGVPAYTRLSFRVATRPGGQVGHRWRPWTSAHGQVCRSPFS